jgi:type II secretory pathway predicted ATPase ExeA
VRERKGFAALTGEVGTGKTTLLRKLMDDLAGTARFVYFYNTNLNFDELLTFICEELNLRANSNEGRLGRIRVLNEFLLEQLRRGGTGVLLIDESQNLGSEVLEDLRLLSNLETGREKLLQIILAGQPELEETLERPELRQLKQRISIHCRLNCLKEREVAPLIAHRLAAAGCKRNDLFAPEALRKIAWYSKGIPRLINIICDNALLIAYATSQKTIAAGIVDEVAQDLQLTSGSAMSGVPAAPAETAQPYRTTEVRRLDVQGRAIPRRVDVGHGSRQNIATDEALLSEKSVLQICDEDDNIQFTLRREELRVLANADGSRDVQAIAESLGASYASTMNVVRRLHRLGVLKLLPSERSANTVPASFFDIMKTVLTEAVGPMAHIIIQDRVKALGSDLTAFPKSQVMRLVGAVSREILHDRLRRQFEAHMAEVIRALENANSRSLY